MSKVVEQIAEVLLRRGQMLACAESCTGGLICKTLTDVPGSSAWFERGFVTYSNLSKVQLLGVSQTVVALHGAVSDKTARAMGEGLIRHTPADWGIVVSGIAGPGGGTKDKPVGTVWIGWSHRVPGRGGLAEVPVDVEHFFFDGDREQIRRKAQRAALTGLLKRLLEA